jgi:predicted dehydrogenase
MKEILMQAEIGWGILGTGRIAHKFAQGLKLASGAKLVAVGSRSIETANRFAERHRIPNRHQDYASLVEDPYVDVVYIASPHSFHHEHALLALQAGKAVLCEKPFTLNSSEAEELVNFAREKNLFLMEGMWTRFFPIINRLRSLLDQRVIGTLQMLAADLGIRRTIDTRPRLFDAKLGGGALLDVGVYPISLASMLFGKPTTIRSHAHFGETGVDEKMAVLLSFPEGELAILYGAIRTETPKEATIMATEGKIRIKPNFVKPERMTLEVYGDFSREIDIPVDGNGMHYEATEVMECLRDGRTESSLMTLDESISVMKIMDAIREQWGFAYPGEKA